ncbi:hypothetical protein JZU68_06625, partial [bacterium]|nr:hypothetical protein [bacterium]
MKSMKTIKSCFQLFLLGVLINLSPVQAQKVAVPITSYGVWDRGDGIDDYNDPQFDYVLGI